MSYVAGMALGFNVGKKISELFTNTEENVKTFTPMITLVSIQPGRRRYRLRALKNNQKLGNLISDYLNKLHFIKKVETNVYTGSLLLQFTCSEVQMDILMKALLCRVFYRREYELAMMNIPTAKLGRKIYNLFNFMDNYLREKTAYFIDFRSVTAFTFIIVGIRKFLLQKQLPSASQLLWWAFSLLRK